MSERSETNEAAAMWSTPDADQVLLDADCSPTKTCRNMVDVSFSALAEPGTDLAAAWRATLQSDGKVADGSSTLADLVFNSPAS